MRKKKKGKKEREKEGKRRNGTIAAARLVGNSNAKMAYVPSSVRVLTRGFAVI
jgi:hypothetical protein